MKQPNEILDVLNALVRSKEVGSLADGLSEEEREPIAESEIPSIPIALTE